MVMRLQMKLKQKLGVAAVFALGVFVIISSSKFFMYGMVLQMAYTNTSIVIRAYYSNLGETMLTCTVSMIETAIAIIASCLPALRSMFIGGNTQNPSSSYGKHYELTSDRRKTHNTQNGHTASVMSTRKTRHTPHDSEDSLVAADLGAASGAPSLSNLSNEKGGIHIQTTFATHYTAEGESAKSAV